MPVAQWLQRTMVIERGCGVALYAVVLFYVYYALKNAENHTAVKRVLNIYILILSVMAFFYIPYKSADLYRWFEITERWKDLSFAEFFKVRMVGNTTALADLMMYLCTKTGLKGFLPAFCSFVFFSNSFYILKDQSKKHGASSENLACALFVLMCTTCFLEVISGVRCFVALSILARCFYDELYNEKPILKNIVFEIVACLIHSMAVVVFGLRLLFFIFQKSGSFSKKAFNICSCGVVIFFIMKYGQENIDRALAKANSYVSGAQIISTYIWGYIIGVIILLQIVLCLHAYKHNEKQGIKNMLSFNLLLFVIELAFVD